jgi:hypothetical protein
MKTRLTCRGSRLRLAMLQYRDHFFVLNLSKVGEELPHSVKLAWHLQTERSVTFPVYRLRGIGRSHCHRRDELLGVPARTARSAATIVEPVATPSSTTMTMRV